MNQEEQDSSELLIQQTTRQLLLKLGRERERLSGFPLTDMARYIDHTLLKPDATETQIRQLCAEARAYGFMSVCVNPGYVPLAVEELQGAEVKVCTVIGFPLGATMPALKAHEAEQAIKMGATEVDMVLNVGALKSQNYRWVLADIAGVVEVANAGSALVKLIIETSLLTQPEKVIACQLAQIAGSDFVKTSTGFSGGGATVADIALMRQVVGNNMGVKASGGIRSRADALAMITAGATRIGTSAGIQIINYPLPQPSDNQTY